MRVLHLATTYPLHPGDSNAVFIEAIAEGLAARGHDIDVLVPWHPELQTERPRSPVRLHEFRYSPFAGWHPWGYAQALHGDRRLRRDAYLAALPAALASCRRVAKLGACADVIHAHWLLPNAPIAAAARGDRPLVVSCHGSGVFLAERFGWAAEMARYALRRATAVTACSAELVARLQGLGAGPQPRRQPYGVYTERFRPLAPADRTAARRHLAAQYGLDPAAAWVLAVGRLVYKKGFDVLVRALPRLVAEAGALQALIVGEGPLGGELRATAATCGCSESLRLLGAVAHAELPILYGTADAVAVPSVHGPAGNVDGLPNTLLEGLASGTPVVASNVAGIPDVVCHEDNGYLVAEADPDDLAAALVRVLSQRNEANRLGARARVRAVEELGWDRVAARFEALYEHALGEPAS